MDNRNNFFNLNEDYTKNRSLASDSEFRSETDTESDCESASETENKSHLYLNINETDNNLEADYELETSLNEFKNSLQIDNNLNEKERDYFIYINSKDRALDDDNTTFSFNISFNDNSNSNSARITTPLKNILKIELLELVIPNFYLDLKKAQLLFNQGPYNSTTENNLRLNRLSSMPYVGIILENLENTSVIGTDNNINKASFMMTVDNIIELSYDNSGFYEVNSSNQYVSRGNINNSFIAGTDKNRIIYKNNYNSSLIYNETSLLPNIKITINDLHGNPLVYLNDKLVINNIKIYSTKILLKFSEYFSSDEFKLGDIIQIKNLNISDSVSWKKESLISYLNKQEGHPIIQHYSETGLGTPLSNTKLFSGLFISLPFEYNNNTISATASTDIIKLNTFDIESGFPTGYLNTNTTNNLINLDNQFLATFKITCRTYEN